MENKIRQVFSRLFSLFFGKIDKSEKRDRTERNKLVQAIRKGEQLKMTYPVIPQKVRVDSDDYLESVADKILNRASMRMDEKELSGLVDKYSHFMRNKPPTLSQQEFEVQLELKAKELRIQVEEFYKKWEDTIKPELVEYVHGGQEVK